MLAKENQVTVSGGDAVSFSEWIFFSHFSDHICMLSCFYFGSEWELYGLCMVF